MTKLFLITTAALLSVAASPVVARDTRPTATPTTEAPQAAADGARVATPAKKYCVLDERTGSRIARKTCKTREAWLEEGFDPLAKN
ncbi:hypothetical protein [Sphingomonas sp.]|uniref:hypothetical protein n=1 Tax=Sphingomonas sp. TaxID=28214 RepID=UPI003341EE74